SRQTESLSALAAGSAGTRIEVEKEIRWRYHDTAAVQEAWTRNRRIPDRRSTNTLNQRVGPGSRFWRQSAALLRSGLPETCLGATSWATWSAAPEIRLTTSQPQR